MRSCRPRPLCWSERSPHDGVFIAPITARICKRKATACRALIDARARNLYHPCHLDEVGAQQRAERIRAERARLDALPGQALEDSRVLEQRRHRGVELVDDRLRHAGRAEEAEPGVELVACNAALGEGRQLGKEPRAL